MILISILVRNCSLSQKLQLQKDVKEEPELVMGSLQMGRERRKVVGNSWEPNSFAIRYRWLNFFTFKPYS